MEESATYRAIVRKGLEQGRQQGLEQGRIEGARHVVLLMGESRFGPPDSATRTAINAMSDVGQLEELAMRVANAASWQELVPLPRRRNGRRRSGG